MTIDLSQVGKLIGAGTVGGFVSGQITRWLSARDERRGHLGKALADLLALRYDTLVIRALREELVKLIGVDDGPQLYTIAQSFLPDPRELHARYDAAVTEIAGFNPILAFQLRSKDFVRTYMATLSTVAARDQQATAAWSSLEQVLVPEIQGGLEQAIRSVAWQHGIRTWIQIKSRLRTKLEIPPTVSAALTSAVAAAKAAGPSGPQVSPQPKTDSTGSVQAHGDS